MRPYRTLAGCLAALTLAVALPARADEPSPDTIARAREEFRRGIALEAAGDFENALLTFKGVALVKSTPQVRFHIATCEEKVGEWVGALGSYRMALFEAQQNKVKDVEVEAQAALGRLEPKIPKLTIHRGAGAAVATVVLDGRELGAASIGAPISVNPGPHVVEATAPGRLKRVVETTLEEGKSEEVALLLDAAPVAGPKAGSGPGSSDDGGPTAMLPIGISVAGLGAASMIVSGVFLGMKESAKSELDAACGADGQSCPERLRGTAEDGALYDTLSTATFIGGASALAIGGTLVVIDLATMGAGEPDEKPSAGPAVTGLHVGPGGFVLSGRF